MNSAIKAWVTYFNLYIRTYAYNIIMITTSFMQNALEIKLGPHERSQSNLLLSTIEINF